MKIDPSTIPSQTREATGKEAARCYPRFALKRSQTTKRGDATNIEEYMPTKIPIQRMNEKSLVDAGPSPYIGLPYVN